MVRIQINAQGKALADGGKILKAQDTDKYGASIGTFIGDINTEGVIQKPNTPTEVVFTGVKDIAEQALYYLFYQNKNTNFKSVSFPDLEKITGNYAMYDTFYYANIESVFFPKLRQVSGINSLYYCFGYNNNLTTMEFPELTTINANSAFYGAFFSCSNLTSVSFTKLNNIYNESILTNAFSSCKKLEDVYFNSLTSSSFGSYKNQFNNMLSNTGTEVVHKIHFPSNLEPTISTLTGYPLFGGTSGYVELLYDLPATE